MFKRLFSGIVLSLGFVCLLNSQTPQLINYQGILTDNAGAEITGTRSIQFLIYDAATSGSLLWSETQSVDVEDGLFNVLLGSVVPIPYELFETPDRYLAIKVEADNEMLPRQRLTSVGYAFQSMNTHLVNFQHLPDNDGVVNEAEDPVSWYKLRDIPADFADGIDDVGSGGSGITQINGGTGLSVTSPTGPTTTLELDMGHGNGIDADMLDGSHASDFVEGQVLGDNDGTVNESGDPVSWFKLKDIPSDFADGTDDVGAAGGISQINVGTGLTVTNPTGPTATLGLDMGHGNGIDADMLDGSHASDFAGSSHDHLGDYWIDGSSTEPLLQIQGTVPWSNAVLEIYNLNNGPAIYGGNSSNGAGLYGMSATGVGVYGGGYTSFGVQGSSESSYGVYGSSQTGFGGYFSSDNDHYDLELGGSVGRVNTDNGDANSQLILSSNANVSVRLDNDGGGDHSFIVVNSSGSGVFTVDESGNMTATGTKSAVVNTESFGDRLIYCVESPEVWFEDMGKASLSNGEIEVVFESVFASIVNLEVDYHVFTTPQSDQPVLLYITEKTSNGFNVKGTDLDGNPVNCNFDYRIVAKRLGYENKRLQEPADL
jgi:hypothetical protein